MAAVGTNNIATFGQFICALQAQISRINSHYGCIRRYYAKQKPRCIPNGGLLGKAQSAQACRTTFPKDAELTIVRKPFQGLQEALVATKVAASPWNTDVKRRKESTWPG